MKKVFLLLLCAVSVALVSCNQNNPDPQGPIYNVPDSVDFNVMKTITNQFSIDSTTMVNVIHGLNFTYMAGPGNGVYTYYRSANEAKSEYNPYITMMIAYNGRTKYVSYNSHTSNNVVGNKSQIISQLGDTVQVYGRDYTFESGRINNGEWISSFNTIVQQSVSANKVDAEWSQKLSNDHYLGIYIEYLTDKKITYTHYTCNAPNLR